MFVCLFVVAWYRFVSVRSWYEWAIGGYDSTRYVILIGLDLS